MFSLSINLFRWNRALIIFKAIFRQLDARQSMEVLKVECLGAMFEGRDIESSKVVHLAAHCKRFQEVNTKQIGVQRTAV